MLRPSAVLGGGVKSAVEAPHSFVHAPFPEPVEKADLDGAALDTRRLRTLARMRAGLPHMERRQRDRDERHAGTPQAVCREGRLRSIELKNALAVAAKYRACELAVHATPRDANGGDFIP
ncbi:MULTISPECIES: hypothetical protein [Burkholderia cepacia complex]|uniref:hypothetical protein n=1 Tax=Burkholderia cepacia complex TaxID=87882 RepID=UPI0009AC169F|nr:MULTISPECIES: hypothetical protein [Burkholderia cepacia complex]